MDVLDLIRAIHKADKIIGSCETCDHIENAEKYLENFKQQSNNEEFYVKLVKKLNIKRQQLNCDFRI
jgi:hypothetical protein